MINELIEKEIEKFRKEGDKVSFDWSSAGGDWDLESLFEHSLQTIAKEVAMVFKADSFYWSDKPYERIRKLADQIINEVSN